MAIIAVMQFVEPSVFTAVRRRHLDDERYRQLQIALMLRSEQGPTIKGPVVSGKSGGRQLNSESGAGFA